VFYRAAGGCGAARTGGAGVSAFPLASQLPVDEQLGSLAGGGDPQRHADRGARPGRRAGPARL